MGKVIGTLVTVGVLALLVGGVVVGVGYATTKNEEYKTQEREFDDTFKDFVVNTETSDVEFKKSEDGKNKVVCFEGENAESKIEFDGTTLKITQEDNRPWYKKWFFNWGWINGKEMKVTIYLAGDTYNNLNVESRIGDINVGSGFTFSTVEASTNTGDIEATDMNSTSLKTSSDTGKMIFKNVNVAGDIKVEKHTGKMIIEDSHCDNMDVESTTGSVEVTKTTADGHMNIKSSTGSIKFDSADAATLNLESSTGSIKGSLLTAKRFQASSSTGTVNVPNTDGGLCVVKTSTGSIKLTVVGE